MSLVKIMGWYFLSLLIDGNGGKLRSELLFTFRYISFEDRKNTTYKGNIKVQIKVVCCYMSVGFFFLLAIHVFKYIRLFLKFIVIKLYIGFVTLTNIFS
jgi:hypothetical protein